MSRAPLGDRIGDFSQHLRGGAWLVRWLTLALFVVCVGALIALAAPASTGADAWYYAYYAFRFRMHGLMHDFGSIRTYGYPLFLTPLTYLSGYSHTRLVTVAGVVQAVLYMSAALFLSARLRIFGERWAVAGLIGILLSPMGLVLVTDTLTDGVSLTIFITLVALALVLSGPYQALRSEAAITAGAALATFAIMIRPANLSIMLAWYIALFAAIILAPGWQAMRFRLSVYAVATFIIAAAVAWTPQAIYAERLFEQVAVLPVCKLNVLQAAFGIIAWKYDTIIVNGEAGPWYYLNPLAFGVLNGDDIWAWYRDHPGRGLLTILAHIFMSFSANSPFVYIQDLDPPLGLVYRTATWFLCIFGLARTCAAAAYYARKPGMMLRSDLILPVGFTLLTVLAITGLNSVSAVESRFNVIPITVLSIIASSSIIGWLCGDSRPDAVIVYFVLGATAICTLLSYAADNLGAADYGSRFQYIPPTHTTPCAITRELLEGGSIEKMLAQHAAEIASRR